MNRASTSKRTERAKELSWLLSQSKEPQREVLVIHIAAAWALRAMGVLLVTAALQKLVSFPSVHAWIADQTRTSGSFAVGLLLSLIVLEAGAGLAGIIKPQRAGSWLVVVFSLFLGVHLATLFGFVEKSCPCFGVGPPRDVTALYSLRALFVSAALLLLVVSSTLVLEGASP
jgi:hypothetical protein